MNHQEITHDNAFVRSSVREPLEHLLVGEEAICMKQACVLKPRLPTHAVERASEYHSTWEATPRTRRAPAVGRSLVPVTGFPAKSAFQEYFELEVLLA